MHSLRRSEPLRAGLFREVTKECHIRQMAKNQPPRFWTRSYTIAAILLVTVAGAWGALGHGESAAITNFLIRLASVCLGALVIILGIMRMWGKR